MQYANVAWHRRNKHNNTNNCTSIRLSVSMAANEFVNGTLFSRLKYQASRNLPGFQLKGSYINYQESNCQEKGNNPANKVEPTFTF